MDIRLDLSLLDAGNKLTKKQAKRRSRAAEAEDGTLTDRAYRELEEMIVTLQLAPGTVLSEQALAVRLKIGPFFRQGFQTSCPRTAPGRQDLPLLPTGLCPSESC